MVIHPRSNQSTLLIFNELVTEQALVANADFKMFNGLNLNNNSFQFGSGTIPQLKSVYGLFGGVFNS
jgi:hypothetical protein